MTALLRIEDLWIEGRPPGGRYTPIVKGVSAELERGEVLALIGESGSGKTTTSLATLGYTRPGCRFAGGHVWLGDTDVLTMGNRERRRLRGRQVAYVAQSAAAAFNPAITIGEQVIETNTIHRLGPREDAERRAVDLYRRLDLPDPVNLGRRYPHQVSGGQLQRLMAAMALAGGPELLVLDEPTTALDVTTQIEVLTAFKDIIRDRCTAALYVAHDLAVVAQVADRIIVLYDGVVVEQGSTEEILHRPGQEYTRTLMAAVRPPPKGDETVAVATADRLTDSVLEVRGLTAGYGQPVVNPVLRDVELTVNRSEVVGVIGESGCGKSTLARVIAGLLPQAAGDVLMHGHALPSSAKGRSKAELQRIQIVFQMPDVAINPRHKVADVLGRPVEYFLGLDAGARNRRVAELLEMVELPASFATRYPGELSGGQKQRINLARALAAEPELILCDEVTSSLDTVVGAAIIELLGRLQRELGVAYLFISHDLSTVASFADRIVVLYAGRVVEQGSAASVLSPPFHPYTRLLLSSVPELRTGWLEEVMTTREAASGIARAVQMTDSGCAFYLRCPLAIEGTCNSQSPPLRQRQGGHHAIACHRTLETLLDSALKHH